MPVRLGFSIKACRSLLALDEDEGCASADVKRVAEEHLREIDKIAELEGMRGALCDLINACWGDYGPNDPIHSDLARASEG